MAPELIEQRPVGAVEVLAGDAGFLGERGDVEGGVAVDGPPASRRSIAARIWGSLRPRRTSSLMTRSLARRHR